MDRLGNVQGGEPGVETAMWNPLQSTHVLQTYITKSRNSTRVDQHENIDNETTSNFTQAESRAAETSTPARPSGVLDVARPAGGGAWQLQDRPPATRETPILRACNAFGTARAAG